MKYSINELYKTLLTVCEETECEVSLYHADEVLSFNTQYSAEDSYLEVKYKKYAGKDSVTMHGDPGFDKNRNPCIRWYSRKTPNESESAAENGSFESPVDMTAKIWGINLGDFMKAVETVNNQLLWQQKKLEKLMKIYDRFDNAEESED